MLIIPAGVKVHLALGYTDMRKGLDGLATLVQESLKQDPFSGHLFAFRGKKASTMKVLFWDGNGLCLFKQVGALVARRDFLHGAAFPHRRAVGRAADAQRQHIDADIIVARLAERHIDPAADADIAR